MSISGDFGKCEVRNWWRKSLRGCFNVWKLMDTGTRHHHPINHPRYHHHGMFVWIFGFSDVWMDNRTKIRRKPDFKIHSVEVGNQMLCTNVSCNFILHLRPSQPSLEGSSFINGQIGSQILSHPSSKNERNASKV